jgi:hypothetical protein
MSPKRLLMTALVTVTILTASALAQKNELTGIVGRTFVSDQGVKGAVNLISNNLHFGNGLSFEINYGRHLMGEGLTRLTFEVPVVFNVDQDLNFALNTVPESYTSYFVTPALRANVLATTGISPWASVGAGIGHFKPSSQLEFGGSNPNKSSVTGIFQIGVGLDVRIKRRWTVRGELRDFWSGTPNLGVDTGKSRQHNLFVGGGVVWRFGKS